jgi:hypothetical protein
MIHPITFCIPEEKIVKSILMKTKILSSLIPGRIETYIYNTEEEYYNEYRQSFFAITTKKSGWDCMRHYEIIANGCIPYFPNIEQCPPYTMALLPKTLFIQGNQLFNQFSHKNINELTTNDIKVYSELLVQFLDYTRENLTTHHMANYMIEKSGIENVSRILYLSGDMNPDYLRCLLLHGCKERFGSNCHDYPKVSHLYESNPINYRHLYGKGITYSNLLEHSLHNDMLDTRIEEDIKNKYYDLVVYGSYHRGMPLYNLICSVYRPNEIILVCGEDIHQCDYNEWVNKGHHVFVRELV